MNLQISDLVQGFDQVKAGDFPTVSFPAVIPAGQAAETAAWTILEEGPNPGEWVPCTDAANAKALNVEVVDATGADPISTIIYKTGEYLLSAVSYDSALEVAGELDPVAVAALEAVNIYLK